MVLFLLYESLSYVIHLLQVILNPILKKKGDRTALFFEGCLRYETEFPDSDVSNQQQDCFGYEQLSSSHFA